MQSKKQKKSKKKLALIMVAVVLASFIFILMPAISIFIYESNFGERYETAAWISYSPSDFDGLKVDECHFPSNDGQLLAGYHYYKDNQEENGVIVLAHGLGGGGHNTYMNVIDYSTSNGYLVFAYDATGNDQSEGDLVKAYLKVSSTSIMRFNT